MKNSSPKLPRGEIGERAFTYLTGWAARIQEMMKMYAFADYCKSTEQMMISWYEHAASVLKHSGDLGTVREHFIQAVLENFLPKTVVVGQGEIIDGTEQGRSGQQDVILYRADFPVITSHTSINTYMIEGVIATIEVKSNLSKEGLSGPFESAARVKRLEKEAQKLVGGTEEDFKKLQAVHLARTFVVGYKGWKRAKSLVENYRIARESAGGVVPDAVYYPGNPGFCVLYDPGLKSLHLFKSFHSRCSSRSY